MYSKVAAVFIKVYNATVGEFTETELFKSASSNNEEEITNVIEDRTPTLFEEHGKLINWIYGIRNWDGTNKLVEKDLFATKKDQDDMKEARKASKQKEYLKSMWNLCKIFPDKDMEYFDPLLDKLLTVRDLYLHVRYETGHSLIKAIEAQNKLEEITKRLEEEQKQAIEDARNEANRIANEAIADIKANADAEIAKTKAEAAEIERQSQDGLKMAKNMNLLKEKCNRLSTEISQKENVIAKYQDIIEKLDTNEDNTETMRIIKTLCSFRGKPIKELIKELNDLM